MNEEKFIRLYLNQPDPPCVSCRHIRTCAREELACEEFTHYVAAGCRSKWPKGERLPSREWFNRLSMEGQGKRVTLARLDALNRAGVTPRVIEAAVQSGRVNQLASEVDCSAREIEWAAMHWGIRRAA